MFSFKVAKCSADWKTARVNSVRSNKMIIHCIFFSRRWINSNLLIRWISRRIQNRMCLINVTSSCLNSFKFCWFTRFMIFTQIYCKLTKIFWANSSRISNIKYVQVIINCHDQVSTWSTFTILHSLCGLQLSKWLFYIDFIGHSASIIHGGMYISRKFLLQYNIIMKMLL